jgi:hypothetical protein
MCPGADKDVLLVLTEWPEFRQADPADIGKAVARRNVADGRHAVDPELWRAAGWSYRALGRPAADRPAPARQLTGSPPPGSLTGPGRKPTAPASA